MPSIQSPVGMKTSLAQALESAQTRGSPVWSPRESTLEVPTCTFRNRLPPLEEMDLFVTQSPDNFLSLLPEMTESIRQLVLHYPEVHLGVWEQLRLILEEAEIRDKLHGRNLELPSPPTCAAKPDAKINVHGEEIVDNYSWLKDRENPDVLKYIDEENQYAVACLRHTEPLQKLLYNEFVSRLDADEESARVALPDGWCYYSKVQEGLEYRLHCRAELKLTGYENEQIYLDENEIAASPEFEDATYFRVGFLRHSPDCRLVAYGVDATGNERVTTFFKDLETGEMLPDRLVDIYEDLEFSSCGKYVYYLTLVPETERAYRVCRHKLGTDVSSDQLLYEEQDEMFCLTMTKSGDGKFILVNSAAQVTSETLYIHADATEEDVQLRVIMPRKDGVAYSVEPHNGTHFFVLTNEDSKNNWLFRVPAPKRGSPPVDLMSLREMVIPHRDFVLIEDFQVRRRHLVVFERSNCHQNVRVIEIAASEENEHRNPAATAINNPTCTIGMVAGPFDNYHYVSFADTVYSLFPQSVNEEVSNLSKMTLFDTNVLRFTYSSLVQPKQVIDYNMDTREHTVVHTERIAGKPEYKESHYEQQRIFATGIDGTAVPMSVVYRKDLLGRGTGLDANPCLLYAYGAYGSCIDPVFSPQRLSLLDRGFVYAIAHVRGGSDMGMGWYEEGKLGKKPNTFHDFISCAECLIKEGYTSPEKLAIYGRSAGGLMIGAVVNMRPELFRSALTEVPFVDTINTMLDSSIPWTAFEWEEWGNPEDPQIYRIMKQYCPYLNVAPRKYPNMLVLGGMNDPRVAFFEPLKWVAKLRSVWPRKDRRHANETTQLPAPGSEKNSPSVTGTTAATTTTTTEEEDHENMLLLRIEEVGHGGNSGQYAYLEDLAFEYAFLISTLQAPVFRIDPEETERYGVPKTPTEIRKKKASYAREAALDLAIADAEAVERDLRQVRQAAKNESFGAAARAGGVSSLSSLAGGDVAPLPSQPPPAPLAASSGSVSNLLGIAKAHDKRKEGLKQEGAAAAAANRRRSTTLLELSDKQYRQNGKPAPSGSRHQSKLADWLSNFF
ncbi:hypothetical protein BGZ73_007466 [Actinomortierella ambigua]|nr:hypothetical protein BGZ73_007466 [Actinomortierella ambigua]